jgi:hypothetical protein
MICEFCKTSIPETAKFCPKCGNKIEFKDPEPSDEKQDAAAPGAEPSASGGVAEVSPEPVKDEAAGGDGKPKSGGKAPLIIVLVVLLFAVAAGGYYYYAKYIRKAPQPTQAQPAPSPATGQAQVPGVPAGQPQPGGATGPSMSQPAQPGSPAAPVPEDQYQPLPQARTRVAIKASALAANFKKGRPVGFASNFRYGASRVVHYVQYVRASVGRTTFSTQYYQDGRLLFKCGPSAMRYASGKYFCRPQQDLAPGNYEVKFFVDGAEEQTLKFNVSY